METRNKSENIEYSRVQLIMDQLPQAIFQKDLSGRFTYVNRALYHLLRCDSASEVIGKTDFDFFDYALAERYRLNDEELIRASIDGKGRSSRVFEEDFRLKDDVNRRVQTTKTLYFDEGGEIAGVQGILWDITNDEKFKKQLEESVESQTAEIRTLIDKFPEAIYIHDLDEASGFRFVEANPRVHPLLGIPHSEFLGLTVFELVPEKYWPGIRESISKKIDAGPGSSISTVYEVELARRNPDGLVRLEITSSLVWSRGKPLKIIGVAREIDDTSEAKAHLYHSVAHGVLANVTNSMCHDIKTPVLSARARARNAIKRLKVGTWSVDYLLDSATNIEKCCSQAVSEIDGFLDRSREPKLRVVKHQINDVIVDTVRYLWPEIQQPRGWVDLSYDIDERLPPIEMDPDYMRSAFINIVRNSLQAIALKKTETSNYFGRIYIQSLCIPGRGRIEFHDDGPGMPQQMRDLLNNKPVDIATHKEWKVRLRSGTQIIRDISTLHKATCEYSLSDKLGGECAAITFDLDWIKPL